MPKKKILEDYTSKREVISNVHFVYKSGVMKYSPSALFIAIPRRIRIRMNTIIIEGSNMENLAEQISADTYCVDREVTESKIVLKVI